MDHPLLAGRNIFLYTGVWAIITSAHILVLNKLFDTAIYLAVLDGLTYNTLIALMGLSYWFAIRFGASHESNWLINLISHGIGGLLAVSLCVGMANMLLSNYGGISESFVQFATPWKIFAGFFYYSITVLFYYLVKSYRDLQEKSLIESKLETAVKEAELSLLKSQINPHFIFNSLNSISALTIARPEDARNMIVKLSAFLRYSLSHTNRLLTTLHDELTNILLYLEIEKVRFGDKLILHKEVAPDTLNIKIPHMILQPLVENAIKYGVYESTAKVSIVLKAILRSHHLELSVSNNFDPEAVPQKGKGIGLKNVRHRLELIYSQPELLTIDKSKDQFMATLKIPRIQQND